MLVLLRSGLMTDDYGVFNYRKFYHQTLDLPARAGRGRCRGNIVVIQQRKLFPGVAQLILSSAF